MKTLGCLAIHTRAFWHLLIKCASWPGCRISVTEDSHVLRLSFSGYISTVRQSDDHDCCAQWFSRDQSLGCEAPEEAGGYGDGLNGKPPQANRACKHSSPLSRTKRTCTAQEQHTATLGSSHVHPESLKCSTAQSVRACTVPARVALCVRDSCSSYHSPPPPRGTFRGACCVQWQRDGLGGKPLWPNRMCAHKHGNRKRTAQEPHTATEAAQDSSSMRRTFFFFF